MTGINNALAAAARRVINAREHVANPPEVDGAIWREVVSEVRDLDRRGDDARATALIDQWLATELARLGLEPPEEAT